MGLDAAWAIGVDVQFATMGVDAVVTRPEPNDTPIETKLIWVDRTTPDDPDKAQHSRRDPVRIAAFKKIEVSTLPRGTRVEAPELQGGTDRTWKVDATDRADADQLRVVLIAADC